MRKILNEKIALKVNSDQLRLRLNNFKCYNKVIYHLAPIYVLKIWRKKAIREV